MIPDITVELHPGEAELLRLELEAMRRDSALYDAAAALDLLSQARGEPAIVDLSPALEPIYAAIARAIDHLVALAPSVIESEGAWPFPRELRRLRDAARGAAGLDGSAMSYSLLKDGWERMSGFTSWTGGYEIGDRLVIAGGSPFNVKDVGIDDETGSRSLTVYHAPEPQVATFHVSVDAADVRVVSINARAAQRIASELRTRGHWLLGARIRLATQLGSSTNVNVRIGEETQLLEVITEVEDGNSDSATVRLERALRAVGDESD